MQIRPAVDYLQVNHGRRSETECLVQANNRTLVSRRHYKRITRHGRQVSGETERGLTSLLRALRTTLKMTHEAM